jgi:hypothetical protein
VVHIERRSQPSLALVLTRKDGALGPAVTKIDKDCAAQPAEQREAAVIAMAAGPPLPGFDRAPGPIHHRAPRAARIEAGIGEGPRAS